MIGIIFTRGDGTNTNTNNVGFIWDESDDTFALVSCNTESRTVDTDIDNYQPLKLSELVLLISRLTQEMILL